MDGFPILSLMLLVPLAAGIACFFLEASAARMTALVATLVNLGLGILLWLNYDIGGAQWQFTERADLFLVAPATADLIGKFAAGIGDDLVTTLILGRDCPVLLAPAMNTRMWDNPIVQRNVAMLRELGYAFVGPEEGLLACGTVGLGRMAEPETIIEAVTQMLKKRPPRQTSKA